MFLVFESEVVTPCIVEWMEYFSYVDERREERRIWLSCKKKQVGHKNIDNSGFQ
jgi:hypothetical protein